MDAKYVGIAEVAQHTGLPIAWIKREADAGRLPCLHVNRRVLFDIESVERALAERADAQRRRAEEAPHA